MFIDLTFRTLSNGQTECAVKFHPLVRPVTPGVGVVKNLGRFCTVGFLNMVGPPFVLDAD